MPGAASRRGIRDRTTLSPLPGRVNETGLGAGEALDPRPVLPDEDRLLPDEDDEAGGGPPGLADELGRRVEDLGPRRPPALREVHGEGGRVEERLEGRGLSPREPDDDVGPGALAGVEPEVVPPGDREGETVVLARVPADQDLEPVGGEEAQGTARLRLLRPRRARGAAAEEARGLELRLDGEEVLGGARFPDPRLRVLKARHLSLRDRPLALEGRGGVEELAASPEQSLDVPTGVEGGIE